MLDVKIHTTQNRGHSAEEIAQFCVEKIVYVSDSAPFEIRDQAKAFQNQIHSVITEHIKQGIRSDRTTVYNALSEAGHPSLAELIRRI